MEALFKRLHDRREPPGIEIAILRKMPAIWLAATLAPLVLSGAARLWPSDPAAVDVAKQVTTADIFVVALIATLWTAVLTVTIACVIVFVMKGPGYVADAYPLNSASRPADAGENERAGR